MTEEDSAKRLLHQGVRALAQRAYSRRELEAKLRSRAAGQDVEPVLRRLEELNLLNDEQYSYNFALRRMKQDGWGPAKVIHSLVRHLVEPQLAEAAVDRVRRETGDVRLLEEYLQACTDKRGLPQDRKSVQKLVSRLQRKGFQEDVIYTVLRRMIPAAAWKNRFDTGD